MRSQNDGVSYFIFTIPSIFFSFYFFSFFFVAKLFYARLELTNNWSFYLQKLNFLLNWFNTNQNFFSYRYKITKSESGNRIECTNPADTCAYASCMCDKGLAEDLGTLLMNGVNVNSTYRFENFSLSFQNIFSKENMTVKNALLTSEFRKMKKLKSTKKTTEMMDLTILRLILLSLQGMVRNFN